MQAMDEVVQNLPSNPKARKIDHAVFRGLSLERSTVAENVPTDHYPVVTTFEIRTRGY